jgi:hypothetical protein
MIVLGLRRAIAFPPQTDSKRAIALQFQDFLDEGDRTIKNGSFLKRTVKCKIELS